MCVPALPTPSSYPSTALAPLTTTRLPWRLGNRFRARQQWHDAPSLSVSSALSALKLNRSHDIVKGRRRGRKSLSLARAEAWNAIERSGCRVVSRRRKNYIDIGYECSYLNTGRDRYDELSEKHLSKIPLSIRN